MLLIYHLVLVCVAIFIAACINALWLKQRSMPAALQVSSSNVEPCITNTHRLTVERIFVTVLPKFENVSATA